MAGETVAPELPGLARFWAKVNREGPQPSTLRYRGVCWEWTAGLISTGYGQFHPSKTTSALAHRYSYEQLVGPIPAGLQIDHLCRNRRCVSPRHLEAVTPAENNRRGLGVAVFNAVKTHCPAGHAYDQANTYRSPKGSRICRACARERDRQPHRTSRFRRALKRSNA